MTSPSRLRLFAYFSTFSFATPAAVFLRFADPAPILCQFFTQASRLIVEVPDGDVSRTLPRFAQETLP
jgi:hypothetical protein